MDVAGVGILALILYVWRKDIEEYLVRIGRRIKFNGPMAQELYDEIKHGDEKHKKWLREKLSERFDQPVEEN